MVSVIGGIPLKAGSFERDMTQVIKKGRDDFEQNVARMDGSGLKTYPVDHRGELPGALRVHLIGL